MRLPIVASRSARSRAVVILVTALPAAVRGEAPQPLEPIVVTAARAPQPIGETLADITVIGADEIARSGVQSLAALLQRQPGVEIVQNGGPASVSGALLRGANRGQTLVLIDGLRAGSASDGSTSLEAIPLDQIERIEILRGPASSLYGADAIGGVVQVFTKRAGDTTLAPNATAGYGTYDTVALAAGLNGTRGPLRYAFELGGRRSSGFNAIVDPQNFGYNPDRDGFTSRNATASGGWTWASGQELAGQYFYSRLNAQFDGSPNFDDRTITALETWSVSNRNKLTEHWTSTLTAGEGIDDSTSETAYGNFPFRTTQRQYLWQNEFAFAAGSAGAIVERREERLTTSPPFPVDERTTNSATGVLQLRRAALSLQGNVRYDDSNQYGAKTTGAIALGYALSPAWRITAGASTGFKAPSFNDLYYPGFSNPDLVPETSKNIEGGVYWSDRRGDARWEARAIAYRNRVHELIVFGCDAEFNCLPQNVADATLQGATLGLDLSFAETQVVASLDLQDPVDGATGMLLPRRAREHGAIRAIRQAGPLSLGVEYVASSLRYDDAANTRKLGGYGVVNLTLEWPFAKGLTLLVRGDNVFDKNYQLAADYSTGGATVYAAIRWQP
jgi:vitamin B12 transporter